MEDWKITLKSEIESILNSYSHPKEDVDGKYRPNISITSFSSISEELTEHLEKEYGFSIIDPDTVSKLDNCLKDLELRKCQTCKNLNNENNLLQEVRNICKCKFWLC